VREPSLLTWQDGYFYPDARERGEAKKALLASVGFTQESPEHFRWLFHFVPFAEGGISSGLIVSNLGQQTG
jgi:hypothetical protein